MAPNALTIVPIRAPVKESAFDLHHTLAQAVLDAGMRLQDGDVLAISSKYVAISEGRVVDLNTISPGEPALNLAAQYHIDPRLAQIVIDEAEHILGGIPLGYLLTWRCGVLSPNAGLDRSNIPAGKAVLLPARPYESAQRIHDDLRARLGVRVGVIIIDSWLVPGRLGTTGIALATAGFKPVQDERGKIDLFGKPLHITQRGIADSLAAAAQLVMGESHEGTPVVHIRHAGIEMIDTPITVEDVAIPWEMCLYIASLTSGRLADAGMPALTDIENRAASVAE